MQKSFIVNIGLNKKSVINALLLIPFFELYTFELLIGRNIFPQFFGLLTTLFSVSRIIITAIIVADYLFRRKWPAMITVWGIAGYSIACILVSIINGSVYFTYIIGSFSYIGLVLLCEKMVSESVSAFIKANVLLFGFYSIVNALLTFVMPDGFFNAVFKMNAVYFLGSKNAAYFYYLFFIYFYVVDSLREKKRPPQFSIPILLALMVSVYLCDSSNALACLFILFVYLIALYFGGGIYKLANAKILFGLNVFTAWFIVATTNNSFIQKIVELLGRNATYSGRDVQWQQALRMFAANPLLGNGIFSRFQLRDGTWSGHAHSVYLDMLAKYGILPFLIFVLTFVLILFKYTKCKDKKIVNFTGIALFSVLLHNVFDVTSVYFFAMTMMGAEIVALEENA